MSHSVRLKYVLARSAGCHPAQRASHYYSVIMGAMASQITSLTIVYSAVYSGADKKTSQLRVTVTGLCAGNSPLTGEFPAQMASNAENVSIDVVIMNMENVSMPWRHYVIGWTLHCVFTIWLFQSEFSCKDRAPKSTEATSPGITTASCLMIASWLMICVRWPFNDDTRA